MKNDLSWELMMEKKIMSEEIVAVEVFNAREVGLCVLSLDFLSRSQRSMLNIPKLRVIFIMNGIKNYKFFFDEEKLISEIVFQ